LVAWGLLAGCLLATATLAADLLPAPVSLRGVLSPDGVSVSIRITVANRGDRPSEASMLEVYLSSDGLVDPHDSRLAQHSLAPLTPSGRIDVNLVSAVPSVPPGRYYVVARVIGDGDQAVRPATDALWGAPLAIGPDLAIEELRATAGGEGVVLGGRVVNRGTQVSAPAVIGAWWTPRDTRSARRAGETVSLAELRPGAAAPFELTVVAGDLPIGEYGVDAEVDPDHRIAESEDDNNRIATDASYFAGPDLVIAALSARQDGGAIVVHDTVANRGNQPSAACGILFFLSRNGIWDAGDVLLGYRIVPAFDPGATSTAETRLAIPKQGLATGRYFLLGKVDGSNHVAESREANNLTLAPAPVDLRLPP
jgi:hypothetical protein